MILMALIAQVVAPDVQVGSFADNMEFGRTRDSTTFYAQVAPVCSVDAMQSDSQVSIDTSASQVVSGVTYTCNSRGGFSRRVSSLNGGALRRGSQGINYLISQSGDDGLAIPTTSLSTPFLDAVPASASLAQGASGLLSVQIPAVATDLLAGEYRDTVTIEITPN